MLKIKDNVDLKELEKHGFKLDEKEWYSLKEYSQVLKVKPISREIVYESYSTAKYIWCDKLYDLIQAGLVEKERDK